jgi:hypothetical protein
VGGVADETTWLGLAAAQAERAPNEIRLLAEILPDVLSRTPPGEPPGPLEGTEDTLARLAVLTGREACAAPAAALRSYVDQAVELVDGRLGTTDIELVNYAISLLNLLTVLRGSGHRPPGADDERADAWLRWIGPQVDELNEDYQRRAACAAIGYGHAGLADRILDGALAGWSQVDTVRELASALTDGEPPRVQRAWLAYLFGFPALLAAGWATFGDLVAAGRAVYVLAGRAPEGELTERIRADLR